MAQPQDGRIPRKIFFYRAFIGADKAGRPLSFDPTKSLADIALLTERNNYWEAEGKVTCCWIDQKTPTHRLRLGSIRRLDLPLIEENLKTRPLELPEASGLAELIHVVFFPNNIVGADYNFHGPRLQRLAYYLKEKSPHNCPSPMEFEQLLNQNAREELQKFSEIRVLQMRISAPFAEVVKDANNDLGNAFIAARRAAGGDVGELEITLKPSSRKQTWLNRGLLKSIGELLKKRDIRQHVDKFYIKGLVDNKMSGIDLLSDKLISEVRIVRIGERGKALDSASAYSAIETSYERLKTQINGAAGIVLATNL